MTPTSAKKKVSFLSIALGSLIMTSLSTGNAEASWSTARCTLQCTKSSVSKSDAKLNECTTNCDNTKIMDILLPNAEKLSEANKKHFRTALKYQQSTIEKQLAAETAKGRKASQSKIKDLTAKQDKLIAGINRLGNQEGKPEETKAPERPKSTPRSAHPTTSTDKAPPRPANGSHISKPPSDLPPSLPPSDLPPTLDKVHGHEAPLKDHEGLKKSNIPTPPSAPPVLGQNPRAILKAELLAQNPGKKPFEIDAMLKQKLETEHAGKTPAEINQALKEEQDKKYPGKSHAEILESLKAAGPQVSSENQPATPSKATGEPSPQAQRKGSTTGKSQGNIMDVLSGLGGNPQARLKKVDPNAPRPTGKEQQQAQPEKNLQQQLEEAMAKRNLDMNPDKKVSPHLDFEQNFED